MKSFFSLILVQPDLDVDYEVIPFGKVSNKSKANKVFSGERLLSKKDAEYIKSNLDENLFYDLIDNTPENAQQHLIDELTNKGIDVDFNNLSEIMTNLLLKFMDAAIQGSDEIITGKVDDSDHTVRVNPPEKNSKELVIDQATKDEARRFCIDHESEIELLPLCQVAFNLNPMHKHVRDLYTEYNKCNLEVRKAIMIMNDIPILSFEDQWKYKYLDLFREDIKRQRLCNIKDLLYRLAFTKSAYKFGVSLERDVDGAVSELVYTDMFGNPKLDEYKKPIPSIPVKNPDAND